MQNNQRNRTSLTRRRFAVTLGQRKKKGDIRGMNDPGDILEPTLREAKRVLAEMKKTKDLAQRKDQSEILLNLCQSAGVFFDLMTESMASGLADMDEDDLFADDE